MTRVKNVIDALDASAATAAQALRVIAASPEPTRLNDVADPVARAAEILTAEDIRPFGLHIEADLVIRPLAAALSREFKADGIQIVRRQIRRDEGRILGNPLPERCGDAARWTTGQLVLIALALWLLLAGVGVWWAWLPVAESRWDLHPAAVERDMGR